VLKQHIHRPGAPHHRGGDSHRTSCLVQSFTASDQLHGSGNRLCAADGDDGSPDSVQPGT
jgi:hypothetical protein